MNSIARDIFRAIHEGKWLSIEYRNKDDQITKYWIGIRDLNSIKRTLSADGLHLGQYTVAELNHIRIEGILSSQVIEGSYCPVNKELVQDIYENPKKYAALFEHTANLKILTYLEMCNRMDTVPYLSDFALIRYMDREQMQGECYALSEEQFRAIVRNFQYHADKTEQTGGALHIRQLAMNVLSIHTARGLYVMAYRKLHLDVRHRELKPDEEITVCTEFTLDGGQQSIRRFLDAEEYELLEHFERNQERIKDCILRHLSGRGEAIDDMPYIIGLRMDIPLDLHKEYGAIMKLYQKGEVSVPLKAFLGILPGASKKNRRLSDCPDSSAHQYGSASCNPQCDEIPGRVHSGAAGHGQDKHDHQHDRHSVF